MQSGRARIPGFGRRPYTADLVSQRPQLGCLLEIVETLALTLIIFVVIQNFIAQPYKVQQSSMERTLMQEQYVLVDKLTPRFDEYKRGDIVVFTPPEDWVGADRTPFIKRVIGVGGDTVEIHDGGVYINGERLDEPYIYTESDGSVQTHRCRPGTLGHPRRRAVPHGRPPPGLGRLARIRAGAGEPGDRSGVAPVLAVRHVRRAGHADLRRTERKPGAMTLAAR